jgi:hypothetical protein
MVMCKSKKDSLKLTQIYTGIIFWYSDNWHGMGIIFWYSDSGNINDKNKSESFPHVPGIGMGLQRSLS